MESLASKNMLPENYRVVRPLGDGSYGQVFKCFKEDTKEMVAVKVLREKHSDGTKPREVEVMETLKCLDPDRSNIIRYHEWFHKDKHTCIVYELLDMSLHDYLCYTELKSVPLHGVRTIIRHLAIALNDLKKVGVIHGDIKLDNIMLVDDEKMPFKVKLIDFGIALRRNKAKAGQLLQALWHRAPEVILGVQVTEAIDVWSLGTVVAELLMSSPLFCCEDEYDLLCSMTALLGKFPRRLLANGLYTDQYYQRQDGMFHPEWTLKTLSKFDNRRDSVASSSSDTPFTLEDMKQTNLQKDEGVGMAEWSACIDLLKKMLVLDPKKRITPSGILAHPFMNMSHQSTSNSSNLQAVLKINCNAASNLTLESVSDCDLTDDCGFEDKSVAETISTDLTEDFITPPLFSRSFGVSPLSDVSEPKRTRIGRGIRGFFSTLKRKLFPCCRVHPHDVS